MIAEPPICERMEVRALEESFYYAMNASMDPRIGLLTYTDAKIVLPRGQCRARGKNAQYRYRLRIKDAHGGMLLEERGILIVGKKRLDFLPDTRHINDYVS